MAIIGPSDGRHHGKTCDQSNNCSKLRGVLIEKRVTAQTTPSGRPVQIHGPRGCYRVARVLGEWQAAGEARLYRLQVAGPDGPAVAEVVGRAGDGWILRHVWS